MKSKRDRSGGDAKFLFDDLLTKKVQVESVHPNIAQQVLIVTEDKVRLCLADNFGRAARSREWVSALGIILTFGLTLTTADFKDFLLLSSQEWRGVTILALCGAVVWFFYSLRFALRAPTVASIVQQLKEGSEQLATEDEMVAAAADAAVVAARLRRASRPPVDQDSEEDDSSWNSPHLSRIPEEFRKVLIKAATAYQSQMLDAPSAVKSMTARVAAEKIVQLRIGYAPDAWDFFYKRVQGTTDAAIAEKMGLIIRRKNGSGFYDRFRNRLIVPVAYRGAVCGFAGISLDGSDPLVLESSETEFFTRAMSSEYFERHPDLQILLNDAQAPPSHRGR